MKKNEQMTMGRGLDDEVVDFLVREHRGGSMRSLDRLWQYYRNAPEFDWVDSDGLLRLPQEAGLPRRLRRWGEGVEEYGERREREVVIENDIAWRIHTLVDFMFGKPVAIQSLAGDGEKAKLIGRVLQVVFDANGGVGFFQDMALLGAVYGFVDLMLRVDRAEVLRTAGRKDSAVWDGDAARAPSRALQIQRAMRYAKELIVETVEAPRAIPVLNPSDYRRLDGYILHYTQQLNELEKGTFFSRLVGKDGRSGGRLATVDVTEVWTDELVRWYRDGEMVGEETNVLGRLPVVHIQNLPQPLFYEGLSEVEPLMALQDELNTRLSDRANRVTLQSFKMYLGKGIENFIDRPVSPGQMWTTDNLDATIEAFGGDGPNPSEDAHINEIREAMDKTSAVTPLAAGLLRDRVGHLTSENALRIVMMGLLARTEKKRTTYGVGIERLCGLILEVMDMAGVLRTEPEERRVKLHWPSPLPENESQRLADAEMKLRIGVPGEQVLAELGYMKGDGVIEEMMGAAEMASGL